jgi:hypothetical protein
VKERATCLPDKDDAVYSIHQIPTARHVSSLKLSTAVAKDFVNAPYAIVSLPVVWLYITTLSAATNEGN